MKNRIDSIFTIQSVPGHHYIGEMAEWFIDQQRLI